MFDFIIKGIYDNIQIACDIWNYFIEATINLLKMDIETYNADVWNLVVGINDNIFVPIGCALLPLFFVYSLLKESIDFKDLNPYQMLSMCFKFFLAETLVCYSLKITTQVFNIFGSILQAIINWFSNSNTVYKINLASTAFGQNKDKIGVWEGLLLSPVSLIVSIAIVVLGLILYITCLGRIIKVLCIIPFGGMVYATAAGGRGMSSMAVQYGKFVLSTAAESLAMFLAICVANMFLNSTNGLTIVSKIYSDFSLLGNFGLVCMCMIEIVFGCVLVVTLVKGMEPVVKKIVG